jgi:hypothetical protein
MEGRQTSLPREDPCDPQNIPYPIQTKKLMTTFDIDREIREALEKKWAAGETTNQEKIDLIIEIVCELPYAERKKMMRALKSKLKELGFEHGKYEGMIL